MSEPESLTFMSDGRELYDLLLMHSFRQSVGSLAREIEIVVVAAQVKSTESRQRTQGISTSSWISSSSSSLDSDDSGSLNEIGDAGRTGGESPTMKRSGNPQVI
jgi:hypothetical protein